MALRIVLARKTPPAGLRNWFSYMSREPSMLQINDSPVEGIGTAQKSQCANSKEIGTSGVDEAEQVVVTLRIATGRIEKVEKVDSGGNRREVATDEAVALAGRDDMERIETALDDAFEAGIISMLDPESDAEEFNGPNETADDLQLRRELLTLIIGSDVRRRLLRRLAGRVILTKKIESRG
ncbi:MAG TPA: hypothetical protein VGJ20_44560 [Xanthobacteraceae bacterium]|jgi:hypothetical protein